MSKKYNLGNRLLKKPKNFTFEGKSCRSRIHHNNDMSGEVYICKDSSEELVVDTQDILILLLIM